MDQQICQVCTKEGELANFKARINDLERRCDRKEQAIKVLEAWQNKAIGYAIAFSMVASFIIRKLEKLL